MIATYCRCLPGFPHIYAPAHEQYLREIHSRETVARIALLTIILSDPTTRTSPIRPHAPRRAVPDTGSKTCWYKKITDDDDLPWWDPCAAAAPCKFAIAINGAIKAFAESFKAKTDLLRIKGGEA